MPENGMTIHHKGEECFLELSERDAEHFAYFVGQAEPLPMSPGGRLPDEAIRSRTELREIHTRSTSLGDVTRNLVNLEPDNLALVSALIDLLNAGDKGSQSGGNWVYEVVRDLLYDVTLEGPFAANDGDPRAVLSSIAHAIATFWDYVEDARTMKEYHPLLFPAPPEEPEAVATKTPAKPRGARKARRKAA